MTNPIPNSLNPTNQTNPPNHVLLPPSGPTSPVFPKSSPVPRRPEFKLPPSPVLRFTPTAWAKLLYFCHRGPTEIGGFGITSADDLLLIEEFQTVHQIVSSVSVAFDDAAMGGLFENQVDEGRNPALCKP